VAGGASEAPPLADPPGWKLLTRRSNGREPKKWTGYWRMCERMPSTTKTGCPTSSASRLRPLSRRPRQRRLEAQDTVVEVLTYVNHEENRTVVGGEKNQVKKNTEDAIDIGMISAGEFGKALSASSSRPQRLSSPGKRQARCAAKP